MSGVAIAGGALLESSSLIAVVPPQQIAGGALPIGTPLPAIELKSVSGVPLKTLSRSASRYVRERVQVTVLAKDYAQLKAILRLITSVIDHATFVSPTFGAVSIVPDVTGPDIYAATTGIFQQSLDLFVSFNEPAA